MAVKLKAMILAAGLGTRLRPVTERMPKALVRVAGRPMITYPLLWLRSQGIGEVVVNTHHFAEMLERELGSGSAFGVRITYSREESLLGTGGGIGRARGFFGSSRLVVLNADTLIAADLKKMLARHESSRAQATMALIPQARPGVYTEVLVDGRGFVRAIGGRPGAPGRAGRRAPADFAAFTFTGLSILDPGLVDRLPQDGFASLTADAIIPALMDGQRIAAWPCSGYWKALDTMERISQAEQDIREGRYKIAAGSP